MPTLDTTIGGIASNSYVTVAEGDSYFDTRLISYAWTNANADDKARGLIMAADRLNDQNWRGERVTTTQALAWPRNDVEKKDAITLGTMGYGAHYGFYECYLPTEIPPTVKIAQMELALA